MHFNNSLCKYTIKSAVKNRGRVANLLTCKLFGYTFEAKRAIVCSKFGAFIGGGVVVVCVLTFGEFGREVGKEVMLQDEGDVHQYPCIDGWLCENLVSVGAAATQPTSKLRNGEAAFFNFCLYVFADMHGIFCSARPPFPQRPFFVKSQKARESAMPIPFSWPSHCLSTEDKQC